MTDAHKSQLFLCFLALTLLNLAAFCWPGKSGKASPYKYTLTNAGVWLHTIIPSQYAGSFYEKY